MGGFERVRLAMAAVTIAVMASLLSLRSDAAQEVRVALVIGNTDYVNTRDLPNAIRDAALVGETLSKVGFTVTTRQNLSQVDMQRALRDFSVAAATADVAMVYYAGHGIEVDRSNYLVPVDASFGSPDEVDFGAIPLDLVMKSVQRARRLKVVVLDSCRDNPFISKWDAAGKSGSTRSIGARGLAPIQEPPSDTLVAYAARAGSTAADGGPNDNSPYAKALTRRLAEPGAEINLVFRKVRDDVLSETGNTQEPFTYGSLSGQEFFFVPKGAKVATGPDPAKGKKPGESFRDCPDCPEMVIVPAGSFTMGSPPDEPGRSADEGPQRKVAIAQAFAVGKFEVTFAGWDACVKGGGCFEYEPPDQGWGRGRQPVIYVGWIDAQAYVKWLNNTTGRSYRLLSEAEWEYAARAGTTTPFSFGATITPDQANYDGNTYGSGPKGVYRGKTTPVGSFPANRFGLHDMHGNVWEWTEDCRNNSYTGGPADGAAWRTGDCARRVLRGGSWGSDPQSLRSAVRYWLDPAVRNPGYGFRVARTL